MKKGRDTQSEYVIQFSGLSDAIHTFEYSLQETFFNNFEYQLVLGDDVEINKAEVMVTLSLLKNARFLELNFFVNGWVQLPCDRCWEQSNIQLENSEQVYVKFGEGENSDEVIFLPEAAYEVDLKQPLYEIVMMAMPMRKLCDREACDEMPSTAESKEKENSPWEALKNLKFDD